MSVESALGRARARNEAVRMTSTCAVMRKTGAGTQSEVTGLVSAEWATVYAELPCRVKGRVGGASPSRPVVVGGVEDEVGSRELDVPFGTDDLLDGDYVPITGGDCDGYVFHIVDASPTDQQSARRVRIEAVQRPSEWED